MRRHQETKRKGSSKNQFENKKFDTVPLRFTVPLKCKLTVSTRFSIFEVFENRVSRFETLEEFFEDLEQRFRGNGLILENKTIAMNKTIDVRLYSGKPAVECMQIFFRVVHFLQDTCRSLIYTEADDSKLQLA